jgi:hypothetical protein
MPLYSYSNDEREHTVQKYYSMKDDIPREIEHEGATYFRDIGADHSKVRHYPGCWPQVSTAFGIPPEDIAKAKDAAKRDGFDIDFTPEGNAIFRDRAHRKRACGLFGYYDRNAGYGDATPRVTDRERKEYRERQYLEVD